MWERHIKAQDSLDDLGKRCGVVPKVFSWTFKQLLSNSKDYIMENK